MHCIGKTSGLQKSIQQMTTGEIDNLIHNDHMMELIHPEMAVIVENMLFTGQLLDLQRLHL
jgi:hypothetical protein